MKLRFTRRATENLATIADYIRANIPSAAHRVRSAIYESLPKCMSIRDALVRRPSERASWRWRRRLA